MRLSLETLEPILAELADVPQNPIYHGEGNVLRHTRMVLDALERLEDFASVYDADRSLMQIAAALHDIGKKRCTRWEDGRWTSPHHATTGASKARELLTIHFGLGGTQESLEQREAICALIRWHMLPLHAFDQAEPSRKVRQISAIGELAPLFTLERLTLLSEADVLGRVCADMQQKREDVALFGELAKEQGCYQHAYPYPDACTRYADLSGRAVAPDIPLFDSTWGTIVMMSGLPGTGKDTYIARHLSHLPMLSLDELRRELHVSPTGPQGAVIQSAAERAKEYLRRKQPFVFNATNLSVMLRSKWVSLFHRYGASVSIIYLETDWDERRRRNVSRKNSIPETAVMDMLGVLSPPTLAEAEEVRWDCI